MNRNQLIVIVAIIIAPVIIGALLLSPVSKSHAQKMGITPTLERIGIIRITDVIYFSENYIRQLVDFREDNSIAGVIVRIDSPGGAVAPSQEIYAELMKFRKSGKPIVVSMGNVAASGGYYIASAATRIFANPGTITGSIGVIMQMPHYYKLLDKVGIQITTVKAGKFKDVGNPARPLDVREEAFLQQIINSQHEQFINDICLGRKISPDKIRPIADGRILTGTQARDAGLVDTIGGYEAALSYILEFLNLPERTKVVERSKNSEFLKNILNENLSSIFPFLKRMTIPAGCYYLLEQF